MKSSSKKLSVSCCPLNLEWPLNLQAFRQKRSVQRSEVVNQVTPDSANVVDDTIEVKVTDEDAGSTSWWWDEVGLSFTNVSTLLDVGSPVSSWTSPIQLGSAVPPQEQEGGLVEGPGKEVGRETRSPCGCQETLGWRRIVGGNDWKRERGTENSWRQYRRSMLADSRNEVAEEKEHHNHHSHHCRLLVLPSYRDVSCCCCCCTGAILIAAAARGHLDAVVAILDQAKGLVDVNSRDYQSGNTASHLASANGYSRLLRELVMRGANVHLPNKVGRSCLHLAAANGRNKCVRILLSEGSSLNLRDKRRSETALHLAVRYGHANVVRTLVTANSCDISQRNRLEQTALDIAILLDRRNIVKLLMNCVISGSSRTIYAKQNTKTTSPNTTNFPFIELQPSTVLVNQHPFSPFGHAPCTHSTPFHHPSQLLSATTRWRKTVASEVVASDDVNKEYQYALQNGCNSSENETNVKRHLSSIRTVREPRALNGSSSYSNCTYLL